jgi:hypothetical protein
VTVSTIWDETEPYTERARTTLAGHWQTILSASTAYYYRDVGSREAAALTAQGYVDKVCCPVVVRINIVSGLRGRRLKFTGGMPHLGGRAKHGTFSA